MHGRIYRHSFSVPHDAIDFNGHVNNVTYLSWMIDAATRHSESVGFGYQQCLKLGGTWVAKSHHIEYRKPALENDTLQIETWIEEIGTLSSSRRYRITRPDDAALICEGETVWVFVDLKRMRPMRIPEAIISGFASH